MRKATLPRVMCILRHQGDACSTFVCVVSPPLDSLLLSSSSANWSFSSGYVYAPTARNDGRVSKATHFPLRKPDFLTDTIDSFLKLIRHRTVSYRGCCISRRATLARSGNRAVSGWRLQVSISEIISEILRSLNNS